MMKIFIAAALMIVLSGCASTRVPVVVQVKVPVLVPCKITQIDKPVFAVDELQIGLDAWTQMRALRADRLQRKGYEEILEGAIKSCQ